jgi:glucose/arabinose dehydrogenase
MMLSATALMTLIIGTAPAAAQTPPSPAPREAPAPPQEKAKPAPAQTQIKGELVSVDAKAKTITVAAADGKDVVFAYNDATVVTGAKEGVAGLTTMTRSQVTVHFTEEGRTRTATRIEVQPRQ